MTLWLVRAGRYGERDELIHEKDIGLLKPCLKELFVLKPSVSGIDRRMCNFVAEFHYKN